MKKYKYYLVVYIADFLYVDICATKIGENFLDFFCEKICRIKKKPYLCTAIER